MNWCGLIALCMLLAEVNVNEATSLEVRADNQAGALDGPSVVVAETLCGPNSLLVITALNGVSASLDELDSLFPNTATPATMLELKNAGERLGLKCSAIRWTGDSLPEFPVPAIIALRLSADRPMHFVVANARVGEQIQIVDFGFPSGFVPLSSLRNSWDGYALYFVATDDELRAVERFVQMYPQRNYWLYASSGLLVMALVTGARSWVKYFSAIRTAC